jgi:hypothetical protein
VAQHQEHKNQVEVVVVVSGQPERLTIGIHQKLEHLVHEALHRSGNHGQPPSGWDLRTEDGRLLDQSATLASAGVESGMTLFLSPHAGAGG